jgi:hypothetical protein
MGLVDPAPDHRIEELPPRERQLVGRLLDMSNFETSNLVVRHEAPRHDLEPADRSWLNERLEEYRELLTYLHDH